MSHDIVSHVISLTVQHPVNITIFVFHITLRTLGIQGPAIQGPSDRTTDRFEFVRDFQKNVDPGPVRDLGIC